MKRLLLFLALTLVLLPMFAQVGDYRSEWAFGVNGGYALNRVSFDPRVNQKWHGGTTFGVTARYTCEKYYSLVCAIQMEVNYTQLGWKENILEYGTGNPLPDRYERNHGYIQVPILARLALGREHQGVCGYFIGGPQLGYNISESTKQSDTWTTRTDAEGNVVPNRPNNRYEQYDMPIENKFDYGIAAGLGMEVSTVAGHFLLEGRYYFGLSDIFGNSKKDVFGRSANGTIMAKITYLFPNKHDKRK